MREVQDPGLEGVKEEADPGPTLGGVEDAAPLQIYKSKRKRKSGDFKKAKRLKVLNPSATTNDFKWYKSTYLA